jgi:hypothetical protein
MLPDDRGDSDFDDNEIASEMQAELQDQHDRQREHDRAGKRRFDPDQDQANDRSRKRGFKQSDFVDSGGDEADEGDISVEDLTEDVEPEEAATRRGRASRRKRK